jgi:Ca2+-binding EF-hand superfamily protein
VHRARARLPLRRACALALARRQLWKEILDEVDPDHDGKIQKAQLREILRTLEKRKEKEEAEENSSDDDEPAAAKASEPAPAERAAQKE